MKEIEEKYLSYIDGKIVKHNSISEHYKEDDRKDESDLEKVKINIYQIFKILFLSDTKQLKGKTFSEDTCNHSLYGGFIKRFDTIPANWKLSLDKAVKHGNITQQVIEETKLDVSEELRESFMKILEDR